MTESKESMQNTIKNLQARTQNIEKLLEKGNKTIVVQLGSHSIKFGLANDKAPYKVRTLIAYKLRGPVERETPEVISNQKELNEGSAELEQKLKVSGHIRTEVKQPKAGKPKAKVDIKMKIPEKPFKQVDPLFDDHAMWVADDPQYIIRRPIKYGLLNIQSYTLEQTLHDLQHIFSYCINQKLKLKRKDHGNYNIVLVIPDLFPRPHLKGIINIFMCNLQFKSIYLHLQSILACFGTSVPSACVVDIGFEKINICCVDEGVILPGTVIRKNFGSRHINEMLLHTLISRKLFGYSKKSITMSLDNLADMNQIDKLKEKACYIKDSEDYSNRIYEVYPIRDGKQQPIPIPHSEMLCLAANCVFHEVFNHLPKPLITECFDYNSKLFELYEDIQDHFEQKCGGGDIYPASTDNPLYNVQMLQPFIYNTLHDMICYSISNIKDADFRRRMANSILLVGGAAHIPGIVEELEDRLIERINHYDNTIERVQIIDLAARDIAPIHAGWLGGAVIPKLDSVRDLWIERNRYIGESPREDNQEEEEAFFDKKFFSRKERSQEWGIRYLKQKIPFQW